MHENHIIGTIPSVYLTPKLRYLNLASNFLSGEIPFFPSDVSCDFRFNYFSNCVGDLCCLMNTNCSECVDESKGGNGFVPFGVEESVWTEMNVVLLGEKKRIIQIETHFSSSPHLLKSYACANTSELDLCNNTRVSGHLNETFGDIRLEMNVPFENSQNPNTFQKYTYIIQGDVCTTNVKVL